MADSKATGAVGARPRSGGKKWVVVAALALGVGIASETGYLGFGWAQVMAAVFPRDEALLGYVPADAGGVLVVDPHQIDANALGSADGPVRGWLARTRGEIRDAAGIDLLFDVDKLVLSPTLAVLRGRFDEKKLTERLSAAHYTKAEHDGHAYLVRAGEDAIAIVDGSVLLYGDEAGIKAAFDAKKSGASLEKNTAVTERLRKAGWDHAALTTVSLSDERPSIRAILTGSTGPRSVSVGVTTKLGIDIDVQVEAASAAAAEELRKLLEEKRADAAAIAPAVGQDAAAQLVEMAKKATITAEAETPFVKVHLHVDPAQLAALSKAIDGAPLREMYKTLRLYQLLSPLG